MSEKKRNVKGLLTVICGILLLSACGTLSNGRRWGQDATLFPGWKRFGSAALNAAVSAETWAPAATALFLQIDDMDVRISDWAASNTPLFGSQRDAERASDYLRAASQASYLITALAAPGGEGVKRWTGSKLKGISVGLSAGILTSGATWFIKDTTSRTRPDGSDDRSFPSGHTASAAASTTLAGRNLKVLKISGEKRRLLRIAITTMAVGTGWARVEAKKHFPSDVLVGYGVGHFLSALINDAFLGLDETASRLDIKPLKGGAVVGITWVF